MQNPQAVIEIGSTGIRLLVAEIIKDKRNILDRSEVPVNLGREVFTNGSISRETLLSCIQILNRYAEQIAGWGITPSQTVVIATTAVREANNRDPFVDRVKVKTGFTVRIIDGIEENRLMYIAVRECLKEEAFKVRQSNSVILEITGGSTEVMLMEKGKIVGAHSMRLGTVIIEQKLQAMYGSTGSDAHRLIGEYTRNTKHILSNETNLSKIQQVIAIGNDMKIASLMAGNPVSPFLWEIKREDFDAFVNEVQRYTIEECIAHFKLSYNDAQTFQISLLSYKMFIDMTPVEKITVPETSIREGLILSQMDQDNESLQEEFSQQITASATTLLKKYQGDEKHAMFVRDMSLRLYDKLIDEIGMDSHVRMLLEVSAILHDIGMFIGADNHHLHSKYIINHSEIFGLSHDDLNLVAEICRFHKGSVMPNEDSEVRMLPRTSRMIILKLSAIVRLADALDRSHMQKLSKLTLNLSKDTLTIRSNRHTNLALEQMALKQKGNLFENVFGYNLVLL